MDVNPEVLNQMIKKSRIVFVDCWAEWCAPCRALTPILEEMDAKYADNPDITFLRLNVDDHRSFAVERGISAIPCVLVYKDGQPAKFKLQNHMSGDDDTTDRIIGLRSPEAYEDVLEQLLEE